MSKFAEIDGWRVFPTDYAEQGEMWIEFQDDGALRIGGETGATDVPATVMRAITDKNASPAHQCTCDHHDALHGLNRTILELQRQRAAIEALMERSGWNRKDRDLLGAIQLLVAEHSSARVAQ